jgi:hypothetical protein
MQWMEYGGFGLMDVSGAGYFYASGTDASTYLQQRAHLSRYNCRVLLLTLG